jgi:hypothetical protein
MLSDAQDSAIVHSDTTTADSGIAQYIEGPFTVPAAMEVIFGLYDRDIECSKWLCKPDEAKRFESKASGDGTLFTRAAGTYPVQTAEGKKMLLITATLSREKEGWEDCHSCAPILGMAMFHEIDGAWFIETLTKDLGEIGSWGQLPDNKLIKIGPDQYGVLFNNVFNGQGISDARTVIVGMVEGEFHVLLDENTSYTNEGMFVDGKSDPDFYSFTSDLKFESKDPGKPYHLVLNTKGRRPVDGVEGNGPIQSFNETTRYALSGTKYVPLKNE